MTTFVLVHGASSEVQHAAFERHADLAHTVRFVESVGSLLDHDFKVTLSEQLW